MENQAFFQGKTTAEIQTLFEDVRDIKSTLEKINSNVSKLTNWKHKVVGMASIVSLFVSTVVLRVHKYL